MSAPRLKILMSAYACEPGKGSESAGGWHRVLQAARFHDVWVITRANNRQKIDSDTTIRNHPHIHWVYYDLPWILRFWKRGSRGIQLYYFLWQFGIYGVAKRLHREVRFDLIHHVTLVRYWTPSLLVRLSAPMIFGPVGGGESCPKSFYSTFRFGGRLKEHLRDTVRWVAEHELLNRATVRNAAIVLATTDQSAERVRKMGAHNVSVSASFALTQEELDEFNKPTAVHENSFRFISMGRLLHWKGFHLGLQAFAQIHKECPQSEYWIVNNGPEKERLQTLARELGIESKVTFFGKLPTLADVHAKLHQSDVLVHPSLHDSFGNVCLEAMAAAKPVICLDLGGPAIQITDQCGFKILADHPEHAVASMATAMKTLYRDPELRQRMGANGRARANEFFRWDRKGDEMNAIYLKVVRQNEVREIKGGQ